MRNLSRSLTRGPWRLLKLAEWAWTDWIWHQGVLSLTDSNEQRGTATRQRNYEDPCLLLRDSEVREGVVWPDFGFCFLKVMVRGCCIATFTLGHWIWWSWWPVWRSRGSARSLNYHLFVISYFLWICRSFGYLANPSCRAVWGVGLRPFACWDCGFESSRGHGCLSCECCVLSGRGLLLRADRSFRGIVPSVVCLSLIVKPR
jgi:hypothetical protein